MNQYVALSVFCCYFALIGGLFLLIFNNLPTFSGRRLATSAYVFVALALASFAHTWFYMFKFMAWSFRNHEHSIAPEQSQTPALMQRIASWLVNTSLFEQAWASVCFGNVNWWWSQQLCLFTVGAWTIFLSIEGRRHNVKAVWAYMLLGQLVAISVASNLFYLALVLSTPSPRPTSSRSERAPASLWIPILLSLCTVAISPYTNEGTFLPNLLLMHSLVIVPTLVVPKPSKPRMSLRLTTLYLLVFVVSLILHTRATTQALGVLSITDFVKSAWTTLHSHPAQSSIGWDVIWTSISFVVWVAIQSAQEVEGATRRLLVAMYLVLATPLVSVGVLAPFVLRPQQQQEEDGQRQKQE
ncbi:hypothetical protein R3P38DRAFT_1644804 [Favolaschia claudopus]|uniref:Taste receptor type 2 n=1 Tax=Favolaschia claudopus TaxID=2862362 RepID=A0AAW0DNF0_9AGAR